MNRNPFIDEIIDDLQKQLEDSRTQFLAACREVRAIDKELMSFDHVHEWGELFIERKKQVSLQLLHKKKGLAFVQVIEQLKKI
jgi:hypothetical protein